MKTLDDVKLSDVLPDSISKDENVAASAKAIDPQLKLIAEKIDIPSLYINIDRLESTQLDHLAMQYDVTVWRDSWPVAVKRSVLKTAISEKRKKGTVSAVKNALASVASQATITEWWQKEPKGTPHTFEIVVTQSSIDGLVPTELQEDLISLIDDAKPLRSHYEFIVQRNLTSGINIWGGINHLIYASVRSSGAVTDIATGTLGMMAVSRPIIKRHIVASAE